MKDFALVVADCGVNNVKSVMRALVAGGHAPTLTADPDVVRRAERLVVPGVGNFKQVARNFAESGLGDAIRAAAHAGTPVMGICVGLQLFFAGSEEAPDSEGWGLLPGRVKRFTTTLPVPHVGWARVALTAEGQRHAMLGSVFCGDAQFFYHVHSYHPTDLPDSAVLGVGDYGGTFPTLVGAGNLIGAQFHPEKSQRVGIELLSAFVRWRP